MKGRNLFIIALPVLVAGIALVILNQTISSVGVVVTGGILFILAGIFNMAVYMGEGRGGAPRGAIATAFSWIAGVAAVILGLAMLLFRSTFTPLVPFMFGVLVAFSALYQFFLLAYGSRPTSLPGWLYIFPTLIAAAAVYLFLGKEEQLTDRVVMLITGIALGVFGLVTLYEAILIGHHNRALRRAATQPLDESADTEASAHTAPKPLDPKEPASNPSHDPEK